MAGSCQSPVTTNGPWILAATILGSSMVFNDGTVVNVALPLASSLSAAALIRPSLLRGRSERDSGF